MASIADSGDRRQSHAVGGGAVDGQYLRSVLLLWRCCSQQPFRPVVAVAVVVVVDVRKRDKCTECWAKRASFEGMRPHEIGGRGYHSTVVVVLFYRTGGLAASIFFVKRSSRLVIGFRSIHGNMATVEFLLQFSAYTVAAAMLSQDRN